MKKILFLAAALVAFAACEKDPENKGPEGPVTEVTLGGETYKVVTLENGQVWMAENLRYVPEGKTVSDDPATNATGIYYPYKVVDGQAVVLKDEASIKDLGYLYDVSTALGETLTAENFKSFEGARGICPEGWHVPTREDWLGILGYAGKTEGMESDETKENAVFYNADYKGAKVSELINADGFNFKLTGYVNKTNAAAKASYFTTVLAAGEKCSVETLYGKASMSWYLSSTGYKATLNDDDSLKNLQFFGAMTTFTGTYPEGRLNCSYSNFGNGAALRCVMDPKN